MVICSQVASESVRKDDCAPMFVNVETPGIRDRVTDGQLTR